MQNISPFCLLLFKLGVTCEDSKGVGKYVLDVCAELCMQENNIIRKFIARDPVSISKLLSSTFMHVSELFLNGS